MTNNVEQNEAGFSLLEVLVAMTIFAIGLLGTAGMQLTALQSNAGAQSKTTINAAAAGIMEEILTWEPDDPKLVDMANPHTWDFDPTANVNNTLTLIGGGSFTAQYSVQVDVPIASVSTIQLEVIPSGVVTLWGGKKRVFTCLKKTN